MTDITYLATVEAHIVLTDRTRPLEDILRTAQFREHMSIQDVAEVVWLSPLQAIAHMALAIPMDMDASSEDCDGIIRESLIGEEYTIAKGRLHIVRVYEVTPLEERL